MSQLRDRTLVATQLEAALIAFEQAAFRAGFEQGIAVAERIVAWLTRQPDRRWQREVREWAEAAIAEARRGIGSDA